jgi:hypothetical protein
MIQGDFRYTVIVLAPGGASPALQSFDAVRLRSCAINLCGVGSD